MEMDGSLKDQASYYLHSYDKILQGISAQGNTIMEALKQNTSLTMTAPLATQFRLTASIQDYFNSNMVTIIIFLSILSSMLMYSLVLQDVNSKTYEYGMLRALGFKKVDLIEVISLKSSIFSAVGLFLGMIVAVIINIALREVLFIDASNALQYELTTASIVIGVFFGILTPLAANILPIKESLSKNLRNALDLTRSDASDTIGIKIERLESVGVNPNQLGMGVLLIVIGILTYYGVPLSFINQNFFAAFVILSLILIMMIIGLTFMSALLFNYIEALLLWIVLNTCCRRDKRIHSIVSK